MSDNEQIISKQKSLMDYIALGHRFEEQNAYFKSYPLQQRSEKCYR